MYAEELLIKVDDVDDWTWKKVQTKLDKKASIYAAKYTTECIEAAETSTADCLEKAQVARFSQPLCRSYARSIPT